MLYKFLFTLFLLVCGFCTVWGAQKESERLGNLVKVFEQNPANPHTTIQLLQELKKQGKSGQEVLDRYFGTQKETDYCKEYNWAIVRDFVNDIHAPQLQYVFEHQDKFIQTFSKEDVFQKLDEVLVGYLDGVYRQNRVEYKTHLNKLQELGYAHYDVIQDYFMIRELKEQKNAEDYFYKARKLFRYFPENRKMIKEITAGALEIMNDVARLKVIQLWAGKTVEMQNDFDAVYNYVLISQKCGYREVARKYANVAIQLAEQTKDLQMKKRAARLSDILN